MQKKSEPLKLGLIGCGSIAQSVHLPILSKLPNVRLVAVAELEPYGREIAGKYASDITFCADYGKLLERDDIEAVVICLPSGLHAQAAIAALERKKHVYLEKPLAINLQEARDVLTTWRRTGMIAMIGFNYRFNALYRSVKAQIRAGRIGNLVGVRSVFSTAARPLPTWKQTRQHGGGVLLDLASHHVDLIRFFFAQEIQQVFAELPSQLSEEDSAVLQLRLVSGLLVQSFFSLSSVEEDRFEIYGQAGKLAVDRYRSFDVEFHEPRLRLTRFKQLARRIHSFGRSPYLLNRLLASANEPSYRLALTHFVAAVHANQPTSPDLWDGYRSLAVLLAAEESAKTGRAVSLDLDSSHS